jgi:hypothetical protein
MAGGFIAGGFMPGGLNPGGRMIGERGGRNCPWAPPQTKTVIMAAVTENRANFTRLAGFMAGPLGKAIGGRE